MNAARQIVLNDSKLAADDDGDEAETMPRSAAQVATELQSYMLCMKCDFIADDGTGVKYKELKFSKVFEDYKQKSKHLRLVDIQGLSESEKTAFFISELDSDC